jgi:hypothetical protein
MELEQHHRQHKDEATSSTTQSWHIVINNMELEQHHQQHEVGTTSSTT